MAPSMNIFMAREYSMFMICSASHNVQKHQSTRVISQQFLSVLETIMPPKLQLLLFRRLIHMRIQILHDFQRLSVLFPNFQRASEVGTFLILCRFPICQFA